MLYPTATFGFIKILFIIVYIPKIKPIKANITPAIEAILIGFTEKEVKPFNQRDSNFFKL